MTIYKKLYEEEKQKNDSLIEVIQMTFWMARRIIAKLWNWERR